LVKYFGHAQQLPDFLQGNRIKISLSRYSVNRLGKGVYPLFFSVPLVAPNVLSTSSLIPYFQPFKKGIRVGYVGYPSATKGAEKKKGKKKSVKIRVRGVICVQNFSVFAP